MMHLHLSPTRSDATLSVVRTGDTLVLNGTTFDFGALPEGANLPAEAIKSDWITDTVHRSGGVLHIPLAQPHGVLKTDETATRQILELAEDGPVALPDTIVQEALT